MSCTLWRSAAGESPARRGTFVSSPGPIPRSYEEKNAWVPFWLFFLILEAFRWGYGQGHPREPSYRPLAPPGCYGELVRKAAAALRPTGWPWSLRVSVMCVEAPTDMGSRLFCPPHETGAGLGGSVLEPSSLGSPSLAIWRSRAHSLHSFSLAPVRAWLAWCASPSMWELWKQGVRTSLASALGGCSPQSGLW